MKNVKRLISLVVVICFGLLSAIPAAQAQQCPGTPTLKIDVHTLDYSEHKPVCVTSNGTFEIKLKPQGSYVLDPAKITVAQKTGAIEIKKKSIVNTTMTVEVGNFALNSKPKFLIDVDGVGVLDPRVRIIPSVSALSLSEEEETRLVEIEEYLLGEYLLALSGLLEIDDYLQSNQGTSLVELLDQIQGLRSVQTE